MLKLMARVLVASGVMCAGVANAEVPGYQQSSQFEVKGIIKPTACEVGFSGGNVWDFGVISHAEIQKATGSHLQIEGEEHVMKVVCEAPASVRLRFVDMKNEVAGGFGIGENRAGQSFGKHVFSFPPKGFMVMNGADLVPGVIWGSSEDQVQWDKAGNWAENKRFHTAIDAEKNPVFFTTLEQKLHSKVRLNKGLTITDEEEFHGVVGVELYY